MTLRRDLSPRNALVKLQDLCARSEQCSHEILQKLHTWGISDTTAQKILARLQRDRYVDDHRFAQAFVRDKVVFNRWGRLKIRLALIQKKIDHDVINMALDAIDPGEYHQALIETLRAKARSLKETKSYESRLKLLKHAASHGFETSLITPLLNTLHDD